jgi:hypothetical protein
MSQAGPRTISHGPKGKTGAGQHRLLSGPAGPEGVTGGDSASLNKQQAPMVLGGTRPVGSANAGNPSAGAACPCAGRRRRASPWCLSSELLTQGGPGYGCSPSVAKWLNYRSAKTCAGRARPGLVWNDNLLGLLHVLTLSLDKYPQHVNQLERVCPGPAIAAPALWAGHAPERKSPGRNLDGQISWRPRSAPRSGSQFSAPAHSHLDHIIVDPSDGPLADPLRRPFFQGTSGPPRRRAWLPAGAPA